MRGSIYLWIFGVGHVKILQIIIIDTFTQHFRFLNVFGNQFLIRVKTVWKKIISFSILGYDAWALTPKPWLVAWQCLVTWSNSSHLIGRRHLNHHHHHCHHLCPVFHYLKMDLHLKTPGLLSWLWIECLLSIIFFSLQPSSISARNVATAINCKISQNLFYFVCDTVQTRRFKQPKYLQSPKQNVENGRSMQSLIRSDPFLRAHVAMQM